VVVYGSPLADTISVGTGSVAYGRGGNDSLVAAKRSANTELWGGDGDDFLTVDGPLSSRLEGGPGNDILEHTGTGSMNGGEGNDILSGASANVSMFGGGGNDLINAETTDPTFTRVVDGGSGVDRLAVIANGLRLTATSFAGTQPTIRITSSEFGRLDAVRFEKVSLTGVGAQRIGITMDPIATYEVAQPGLPGYRLVVTVPVGQGTISGNTVTAAGFGSVSWADTTNVVVRGTAS
jgi:Ca2+-binding RTX toxin-like protein